ncbi:MAG: ABC transporter permease, partial [Planctomycetota bacterium]|nr:ABC transporter permease [Planctomycetota bacterium]
RSLGRVLIQDVNRVFTSNANTQIYIRDATYKSLGNEWYIPVIICAVVALVLFTLMRSTVTGRHLYAIGGNEDAARLSGISTEKKKWLAYCIGTMTAALAGILYSSYVGGAMPDRDGLGYELNAIAAAVVGGCSLAGGLGTISGIVLGAIFLRVVIDAVAKTVKDNPDEFQGMIVGLLVVLAVTFNELRSQKGDRKKFFPGALGIVNIISLTVLMGLVAMLVTSDGDSSTDDSRDKLFAGCLVAGITFAVLVARKMFESRPAVEKSPVPVPATVNVQSDSPAGGSSPESGRQEIEGDGPGGGEADEGRDS